MRQESSNLMAGSQTADVEIPPEEWGSFFNGFSRQHEGWLVTLKVTEPNGETSGARNYRLKSIRSDHREQDHAIYLTLARNDGWQVASQIRDPARVVFHRDLKGAHEGLDIKSADGTLTSIRFRVTAQPETLDGVLPESQHMTPNSTSGSGARRSGKRGKENDGS